MDDKETKDVQVEEKKSKKQSIIALLIKRNKLGFFILVFFTLAANVFAWFIYSQIVSSEISASVKSWNISMAGEHDGVIEFTLEDLYPGMPTHSETVELSNNGDMDATVSFTIHSITIMGETHSIEDTEYLDDPDALQAMIDSTYPFTLTYNASSGVIQADNGVMTLNFEVSWPYDSGQDDLDTYWGEKAYEYQQAHPGDKMLTIVLDVHVVQAP